MKCGRPKMQSRDGSEVAPQVHTLALVPVGPTPLRRTAALRAHISGLTKGNVMTTSQEATDDGSAPSMASVGEFTADGR